MESMQALARALDCPVADLLNDSDNPDRLSVDERQLISSYRSASALQKDLVRRLAAPLEK